MEITDLKDIESRLKGYLVKHMPPLRISKDRENVFEVTGTIEAMQGQQKVDGFYFGSVVPKPTDIRLYFFPIYTHPKEFAWLSDELRKYLKGKSCFHVKKLPESLDQEFAKMIDKGVEIYKKNNLI